MTTKRCTKVRFPSEVSAKIAMSRIVKKDNRAYGQVEKRVYWCGKCKAWHLTKKDKT